MKIRRNVKLQINAGGKQAMSCALNCLFSFIACLSHIGNWTTGTTTGRLWTTLMIPISHPVIFTSFDLLKSTWLENNWQYMSV